MTNKDFEYTNEDYQELRFALDSAEAVCPPDIYQARKNKLLHAIAEFLLKPYIPNKYCEKHDCYYKPTGEWIDKKCSDEKCTFCANRPDNHPENCEICKENDQKAYQD